MEHSVCPREAVPLKEEILAKQHNTSRRYYFNAISHRHERIFPIQSKLNENAKRLLGTIPLEKSALFDSTLIKSQIDKRESVLRHLYEMVKYINYLHRICEFLAVSADGYGNNPSEFRNSLQPMEIIVFNMGQILEGGKGYKAIEQIKQLHTTSEKILERLRRAVTLRELTSNKYNWLYDILKNENTFKYINRLSLGEFFFLKQQLHKKVFSYDLVLNFHLKRNFDEVEKAIKSGENHNER